MYLTKRIENKKYSTLEACYHGMNAIFDHTPNKKLHHKNVIKDLRGKQFYIEEITLIKKKGSLRCDVVVKDEKGFRSYDVRLERNAKYPHYHRIYDVSGQKIVSEYQHKNLVGASR